MTKIDFELVAFDDEKLRLTLTALADSLDEKARKIIYRTYSDPKIMSYYQGLRASGVFEKGSKSKVHREVVRFPSPLIYDFVNKTLSAIYGPDWMYDKRAMHHDLVRPWWIVEKW
jgi:hypothetical protein